MSKDRRQRVAARQDEPGFVVAQPRSEGKVENDVEPSTEQSTPSNVPCGVSNGLYDVGYFAQVGFVKLRDVLRPVLQVSVDQANEMSVAVVEPHAPSVLDTAVGRQSDTSHARIAFDFFGDPCPRGVRATVVDDDEFRADGECVERGQGSLDQRTDVALFIEARRNDRERNRRAAFRSRRRGDLTRHGALPRTA